MSGDPAGSRLGSLPHVAQRLRKGAGDLHLADSELTGDLGLGQVLVETKLDRPAAPGRQPLGETAEEPPILSREQTGVIKGRGADGGGRIFGWPVERQGIKVAACLERLEQLLVGDLQASCDFLVG